MISELTTRELPQVAALAPAFWREGRLPGRFDPVVFVRTWSGLMSAGIAGILGSVEDEDLTGVLGYILFPDPNDGDLVASEMFWFVHPDSRGTGLRLLRAFEQKAADLGARRVVMAHLTSINGPELRRLYERRGYREVESHYLKEVV